MCVYHYNFIMYVCTIIFISDSYFNNLYKYIPINSKSRQQPHVKYRYSL